jgi:hypothetical protein
LRRHILWFLVAVVVALFVMWTQAGAVGGWTGLLTTGEESLLRPLIEEQIDDVVIVDGEGNDGQIYYGIALDLEGDEIPDLINLAGLRYRRALFPAVSSLFGTLEGEALFWSMVVVSTVSIGVASAALADIGTTLGLSHWVMIALLANPSVWLALHIVVPDPLAIALALLAVALSLRHRHGAAMGLLALAALSKEPFLLFAFGLAGWLWFQRRRRLAVGYAVIPVIPVGVWALIVSARMGGGGSTTGISLVPFKGVIEASDFWSQAPSRELVGTVITFIIIGVGVVVGLMPVSRLVKWTLWPWIILLLLGSADIWRFGLGTLRIVAPIGILAGVGIVELVRDRSARQRGVPAI